MAKTKKRSKGMKYLSDTFGGRWISTSFLGRHWGVIVALVLLAMIYITNRYECITAMETINKLDKELQVMKSERIREKSYYMSNIRESAIKHRVDSLGLDLEIRQAPPFRITR